MDRYKWFSIIVLSSLIIVILFSLLIGYLLGGLCGIALVISILVLCLPIIAFAIPIP